ncbi:MAG: winged helix-turn-helix transcriptional regulator [Rhizobiales bacterium]|nr:winged helix-turn-helix transcriptional regulator [Hyphomicrobiales bacterium]
MSKKEFDLSHFIPYLLNQAAEKSSRDFENIYKIDFGITQAQWRVIANLGKYGTMSSKEIRLKLNQNKTSISRAVYALEEKGLLARKTSEKDRRYEELQLTADGQKMFKQLGKAAITHNQSIFTALGQEDAERLTQILNRMIE